MAWAVSPVFLSGHEDLKPLGLHDFVGFSGSSEKGTIFRGPQANYWGKKPSAPLFFFFLRALRLREVKHLSNKGTGLEQVPIQED